MNASRIAVWLLELVTSPDRAVTTVGDFIEESSERRQFWFWRQIAQTFIAQVGHEFISAGPCLIVECVALSFAYLYVAAIVGMRIGAVIWYRAANEQTLPSGVRFIHAEPIPLMVLCSAPLIIGSGWLLAAKTNRPIAASCIFALTCVFPAIIRGRDQGYGYPLLYSTLVLVGAIWQRRRTIRASRTAE